MVIGVVNFEKLNGTFVGHECFRHCPVIHLMDFFKWDYLKTDPSSGEFFELNCSFWTEITDWLFLTTQRRWLNDSVWQSDDRDQMEILVQFVVSCFLSACGAFCLFVYTRVFGLTVLIPPPFEWYIFDVCRYKLIVPCLGCL